MDPDDLELTDAERDALHHVRIGVDHVQRAFGSLLEFHHEMGSAMDRFEAARESLREAGHDEFADALRDDVLPAGAVDDRWSYELVESFREGLLPDAVELERAVRDDLADGVAYVRERALQREWRERADRSDGD